MRLALFPMPHTQNKANPSHNQTTEAGLSISYLCTLTFYQCTVVTMVISGASGADWLLTAPWDSLGWVLLHTQS